MRWEKEYIPFWDEDGFVCEYYIANKCPACGGIVFDEAQAFTYCPYCGKKLREEDDG